MKTRGFCKQRLLCQFSPESTGAAFPLQCQWHSLLPCLPSVFFIPKSEAECARRHQRRSQGCCGAARQEADSQFLAPARQCPARVGMARPHKRVLAKYQDPFFASQGLKLILCMVPSPHISPTAAACQCGVWTEATLPCCWPPKYLLALLHCFAVVFPSVPNYNKTTY